MGKSKIKNKNKNKWAVAKRKFRLNARHIAMAKELGMNPNKFGKLVPNKAEPWKMPLGQFIEESYRKRFKNREPQVYKE
jgi:hypothetical protein